MLTEATRTTAQVTAEMTSQMASQMTSGVFVVPVVCTAIGVVLYAGWIGPWDARRTLRSRVRAIGRQVQSDQDDQLLPDGAERVELFRQILQFVEDDPTRWRARLLQRPVAHDPGSVLTGLARARLDRYVQRLERALARYRRRVRFTGARIALDVDDLLSDSRIPAFAEAGGPAGLSDTHTTGGTVLPVRGALSVTIPAARDDGGPGDRSGRDLPPLTPVGWTGPIDVRDRGPVPFVAANHPPG